MASSFAVCHNLARVDYYSPNQILGENIIYRFPLLGFFLLLISLLQFRLTLFGRDRQGQGTFEDGSLESIGVLIRTHKGYKIIDPLQVDLIIGPFRIDILSIKLLSKLDSEYSVESEYKRPNFHRIGSSSTLTGVVPGNILRNDAFSTNRNNESELKKD